MYKRPTVKPGDYTMVCDRTGFRLLASQLALQWDNLMVWGRVWENRQPQDYLRGIPDNQSVPIARPKEQPRFLEPNQVTPGDL